MTARVFAFVRHVHHRVLQFILPALLLMPGLALAQSWTYVEDIDYSDGAKTNIAGIQTDDAFLGVMLDPRDLVYVMVLSAADIADTEKVSLRIRFDGNWEILQVYKENFIRQNSQSGRNDDLLFYIEPDILELLITGDLVRARTGGKVFSFPMSGASTTVSQLLNWGDETMAITEPEPLYSQAMLDCDQRAAHPWDNFREAEGVPWGELNTQLAISACREAIDSTTGIHQTRAIYQLGRVLDKAGDPASLQAITEAAENRGYPAALGHLGVLYEDGDYVSQSNRNALYFLELAAENGFAPAQLNFAELALIEAPERKREAFEYMHAAAEAGYPRAMEVFGRHILNGNAPEGDGKLALQMLRNASDAGLAAASMEVARIYRDGLGGVRQNPSGYLDYLRQAARQGNKDAQEALRYD